MQEGQQENEIERDSNYVNSTINDPGRVYKFGLMATLSCVVSSFKGDDSVLNVASVAPLTGTE